MEYKQFINTKLKTNYASGFDVSDDFVNSKLFPFQKWTVKRALKKGKFAIFADCGLGKTIMQLEIAYQVSQETKKPVLILCPLAVLEQTIEEGKKFGYGVSRYDEWNLGNIQIANYDQIENIDCLRFSGICLDESSILKNFQGAMRNKLIESFASTPYRFCFTATPSPNDPMELGNHAEFLGIMTRAEMLAMYFVHDGGNTSKWRLKKHGVDSFYQWVSSWAAMFSKPSDIGFSDEGYNLPGLKFIEKEIKTPKKDNGMLFNTTSVSATEYNAELRITLLPRIEAVAEIVNKSNEPFLVWAKQNEESDKIHKLIPDSVEVHGQTKDKAQKLIGFAKGEFRVLVTKAKIAQYGLNYQHCNNQIFSAVDFSFETLYQAIRRSHRFGQSKPVNIYIITTDTMQNVIKSIKDKDIKFKQMQRSMQKNINKAMRTEAKTTEQKETKTDFYHIMQGDCVDRIKTIESESIGFSVFSPPFADLYTYSDDPRDMGNSKDYGQFVQHFGFLVKELYRVLKPGRNIAIHCMDLPIQKGKEGFIGLRDFSGTIREMFESEGFVYHSRVTIWKNPVTEMQRTKALGLLHKQLKKDSTMSRVGIPDYVLIFRKDGERNDPVKTDIPVDLWQKWASPVWMDIDYGNTLQYMSARDGNDEKHICPLQLDTIHRLIALYTNKGDTVLTPFMGIGSEVWEAIKMERFGIGIELKESYFNLASKNCNVAMQLQGQLTAF